MQFMSASVMRPGDCAVVISNSGRTRDLIATCDMAKRNGATTISITASGSPLSSAGHIHLAADHPEGFERYCPMVSRLLHIEGPRVTHKRTPAWINPKPPHTQKC
jgi:RpiR family carbohydrate utilization transcriptional regulator